MTANETATEIRTSLAADLQGSHHMENDLSFVLLKMYSVARKLCMAMTNDPTITDDVKAKMFDASAALGDAGLIYDRLLVENDAS